MNLSLPFSLLDTAHDLGFRSTLTASLYILRAVATSSQIFRPFRYHFEYRTDRLWLGFLCALLERFLCFFVCTTFDFAQFYRQVIGGCGIGGKPFG